MSRESSELAQEYLTPFAYAPEATTHQLDMQPTEINTASQHTVPQMLTAMRLSYMSQGVHSQLQRNMIRGCTVNAPWRSELDSRLLVKGGRS